MVRRAEVDGGARPRATSEEAEQVRRLTRENAEMRRANGILKAAAADSTGRRNTSSMEVLMGRPTGWMRELTGGRR